MEIDFLTLRSRRIRIPTHHTIQKDVSLEINLLIPDVETSESGEKKTKFDEITKFDQSIQLEPLELGSDMLG